MSERDPLGDLRAAWRGLKAPDPEAQADADPQARNAVAWVRAAWAWLEVPSARLPFAARIRTLRRSLGARRSAAAAALLLAAGAALWWAAPSSRQSGGLRTVPPATLPAATPVLLASSTPQRMEFQSGPVRLTLLRPPVEDAGNP